MNDWIIVPVVLPAALAALIVLAMRGDLVLQRVASLAGSVALLAVALALFLAADRGTPETYRLGDWPAPFGIVLVLDRLSALMVLLTALLALVVNLYAVGSGWDGRGRHFHALYHFQMMGLCGAFLTGDAFNLFVFFEVLLIASYGLMIHAGGRERLKAGVQYVAYNLVGSTLFLFALATIYGVTGTLNMADLAVKVAALPAGDAALIRVAGVLLLMVFAVKGALVPLQFWLPATYANAPGPVAALFAVMTKVGAYAVLRLYTLVFPPGTPATGSLFADLLLPAALVTLVIGAVGVLGASGLMRMAAFAALASMGTLFTAVALFTPATAAAALYYLVHSTLAGAVLFLIADLVIEGRGTDSLRRALPPIRAEGLVASFYFVAAIAIAGMPPLSGFIGKLLVLDAARGQAGLVWPVILVTSLITIVGLSLAGSLLFWKSHGPGLAATGDGHAASLHAAEAPPVPVLPLVAVGALLALIIGLTIFAAPVDGFMRRIAADLFDPAPYILSNALAGME